MMFNTTMNFTPKFVLKKTRCPADAGKFFNAPASMNVSCALLNSTQGFVKNLTNCTVVPSDNLVKNATYFIRYTAIPSSI
jgi:hypothetical protein